MSRLFFVTDIDFSPPKVLWGGAAVETVHVSDLPNSLLKDDDSLIVLLELNQTIEGRKINESDFYGFKLCQLLRSSHFLPQPFRGKILFVTFLHKHYLLRRLESGLLESVGHGFTILPQHLIPVQEFLDKIIDIDDLALYDIQHHFCDIYAMLQEQLHHIKPSLERKEVLDNNDYELLESIANKIPGTLPLGTIRKCKSGAEAIQKLESFCISSLKSEDRLSVRENRLTPKWDNWKVLWLDDNLRWDSPIIIALAGIIGKERILLCSGYEEALYYWESQKANRQISIIVSDYRLTVNGLCKGRQGYHFLKLIADEGAGVALIAYSGLTRKYLLESLNHFGQKITTYSKLDFPPDEPGGMYFIIDMLIKAADEHWMVINNLPSGSEWARIAPVYFKFKNSNDFTRFDHSISQLVKNELDNFIRQFKQCNNNDVWALEFADKVPRRTNKFPGLNEKGNNGEQQISVLKEILLQRRYAIALYTWLIQENPSILKDAIFEYLKCVIYNSSGPASKFIFNGKDFAGFKKRITKNASLKQLFTWPALTFYTSWPVGLLPEEYSWLEFDSGLEFKDSVKVNRFWQLISFIKKDFKAIAPAFSFARSLTNNYLGDGQDSMVHITNDGEPLIRCFADIKTLFIHLHDGLRKSKDKKSDSSVFINFLRNVLKNLKSFRDIKDEGLATCLKGLGSVFTDFEKDILECIWTSKEIRDDFLSGLKKLGEMCAIAKEKRNTDDELINHFNKYLRGKYKHLHIKTFKNVYKIIIFRIRNKIRLAELENEISRIINNKNPLKPISQFIKENRSLLNEKGVPLFEYSVEDEYIFYYAPDDLGKDVLNGHWATEKTEGLEKPVDSRNRYIEVLLEIQRRNHERAMRALNEKYYNKRSVHEFDPILVAELAIAKNQDSEDWYNEFDFES